MIFYDLDETSPAIKQSKGLKIKLRMHQLTSIAAMRELEKQGTIFIDKPDLASGLYNAVKPKLNDISEFTKSTFIIETNSAILADKVGSGKSHMIIGLILNTLVPNVHDRFIIGTDHFSIKMLKYRKTESVNLIVVPHNLANQWKDFVEDSNLDYLKLNNQADFDIFFDIDYVTKKTIISNCPMVIYNIHKRNKKIISKKIKKVGSKTTKISQSTKFIYVRKILNLDKVKKVLKTKKIFILNINRYKFFKQIFRSIKWARVIIDEMDSTNIPSIFNEFGNFNWFLTATPTSIFYKSCKRYVNKIFGTSEHLLSYFIVKNKDEYVDKSIVLPKPFIFFVNTFLKRVVDVIQDLIPSNILQLINAGNMKEAIIKLNCDVDTEENIIKVLTHKINTELHNLTKELEYNKSLISTDVETQEKHIKKIEDDIGRCKTKLETINEKINSIKNECCFICADSFNAPTILDCCKNIFCLKCLLTALKTCQNKCPYCRHVIKSNKEYHVIKTGIDKIDKSAKRFIEMDKSDALEYILLHIAENNESPKILIFSDFKQTFDKIIKNIAKAKLQYSLLSGVPTHITNIINEFKAGITNILMLDSQHYGSGLNLQDADYLILYHRMTFELETQVIGRAQRFGRKNPLKIIYLVNDSENKISKISVESYNLESNDELWMLTNPLLEDNEKICEIRKINLSKKDKKLKKLMKQI